MPSLPVTAVDLDDTCLDSQGPFVAFQNEAYGLNLTLDDYVDDRFWLIWNCSREEAVRRTFAFHRSEHFERIRPIEEAAEALRDLLAFAKEEDEEAELHIVTARPAHLRERTAGDVHRFFPGVFADVHFSNTYDPTLPVVTKAEVCTRIRARRIIDDTHRHAHVCAEAGLEAFLIDFAWNRHLTGLHPNIRRVQHLRDVVEHLKRQRRRQR
jgi:uncharacterized HAD superfamily protein